MVNIKIVKARENAKTPTRETEHSAGWDLYAAIPAQIGIAPGGTFVISTGLKMEIPIGWEGQVRGRSGLATKGLQVANAPGTIDSDFRGIVGVILYNASDDIIYVNPGDRIAQLVVKPLYEVSFTEVTEADLVETPRGDGGFGSTGQ